MHFRVQAIMMMYVTDVRNGIFAAMGVNVHER